jgi:hypothetical protein
MLTEIILLLAVTWAVVATVLLFVVNLERRFWRREAEASQDEALRWEQRVAQHEGSKGNGNA